MSMKNVPDNSTPIGWASRKDNPLEKAIGNGSCWGKVRRPLGKMKAQSELLIFCRAITYASVPTASSRGDIFPNSNLLMQIPDKHFSMSFECFS